MTGKRILIILAILILIFAGVVLVFIFSRAKQSETNQAPTPTPIQSNFKQNMPQSPIERQAFPDYSIGVPEDMDSELLSNTSGGTTLVIKPKGVNPENLSITVQQTDASLSSFEKQKGIFEALGHSSTNISLGGVSAVKYVNQISGIGGKNLYETVVLFQKGNTVYQVRLSYQAASVNENHVATFDAVLANLSVN